MMGQVTGRQVGTCSEGDDRLAERDQDYLGMAFRPVSCRDEGEASGPDDRAGGVLDGDGQYPQARADTELGGAGEEPLRHERGDEQQRRARQRRRGEPQPPVAQLPIAARGVPESQHLQRPHREIAHGEDQVPGQPVRLVREGLRKRHRQHEDDDHDREPDQRHDTLIDTDDVAQHGEGRPGEPEQCQHQKALQQRGQGEVLRGRHRHVDEGEDEDQVVEELQPGHLAPRRSRHQPPP
jgi:hypothetical protein